VIGVGWPLSEVERGLLIKQSVVGFGLKKSNQSMSMDSCMGLNELLKITSMGRGRMPVD